jgi:ribosomal protein L12E/L44/L45/RPP1/RPP2
MWNNKNSNEVACSLASLILLENDLKTSSENFEKIFKACNLNIETFWYSWFFSKLLKENNLIDSKPIGIIKSTNGAHSIEKKSDNDSNQKSEILVEKNDESEEDMGFGLFD